MIPLGTDRPLSRPTLITIALIAMNVIIFLAGTLLERFNPDLYNRLLPQLWVHGKDFHWWTLFTSVFLHAGWMHLLGNMLFLWVFGQNVEDRFGRIWFTIFYLTGGVAASALHATFSPNPAIGASGAISAVTGAFIVLFPRTNVRCLMFFFWIGIYSIPSWLFILFGIARDFVSVSSDTGVAHLAHIGGYSFGILVSLVLLWRRVLPREPYDLFSIGRQAYRRRQFQELGVKRDEAIRRGGTAATKFRVSAESQAVAAARAKVSSLAAHQDLTHAGQAYRELVGQFAHCPGATVLAPRQQIDVANHLYAIGDHQTAAYAYEQYFAAYPKDSKIPEVRLLLGLLNTRFLNDPVRARAVLSGLPPILMDLQQRELAQTLIEELG